MRKLLVAALCAVVALAQDIPRPEYPQPQFQREQWQTLNGRWEFDFDDSNVGLTEDWSGGSHNFTKSITVPYCFESRRSGIADTSFHPWVWYHRTFTTPDAWSGKRVLLHFGAVDYRAKIWINGRAAGEHEGGNVPIHIDATPFLKKGSNSLVVRAEDPPTDRSIPRGKQFWEPKSRSIFYTRTSGIWQPVWIEATGETYIRRVRITPANDGTVRFDASLENPAKDMQFSATVRSGTQVVATGTTTSSVDHVSTMVSVPSPQLWSLNSPNLYDVTFEVQTGGKISDRVQSYFGFRSVGVENGRVTLNDRPVYVKMVLDQGYRPDSILTPPTDEAIQYDIRTTKDMGFNGVRKHQKVEDPRYLYWADKMGLLVSGEMANAQAFDDDYVKRFTHEWIEAVERDYNHPSIIMWVPINESWGTPNLRDVRQQDHLKSLYQLTHSLDSTRPVIDNDGWEHTNMTDLFAIHDYTANGAALEKKYKEVQVKPGAFVPDNGKRALIPGYQYNGTPILLSEFGGIAYIPDRSKVPEGSWGYSGVERTADTALARLEGLYVGISAVPAFAGICYTQLTDVEQEVNGLMTYDRVPKFDVKRIREFNDTLK